MTVADALKEEKFSAGAQILKQGDPVTVNTDGTLFTEVQLSDEYRKLQEAFGWTEADFLNVNLTALQCASFSEADKAVMKAALEAGYVH